MTPNSRDKFVEAILQMTALLSEEVPVPKVLQQSQVHVHVSEHFVQTVVQAVDNFFNPFQCILGKTGPLLLAIWCTSAKKVQGGKDQEKAQSEKDSHSKNRGRKNQTNNQVLIP